ncbi:MAG: long-chain fatty acid--CoA ligase [Ectothiorhodospiraceae bacterium]|nr:long-chain fatty acid--CoA ligase [Chromatiales bacterium]MCP5154075.1 long-chain fatty acid--CoA ligase [Ectothiorhodospiraceae bacterium]
MNPVADRLVDACLASPRAVALDDGDETIRYLSLLRAARAIAADLARHGLRPREPVVVAVSNRGRDVVALLGVWLADGVAVPIHRQTTPAVASGLLARLGARLVVNARPDLDAPAPIRGTDAVLAHPGGAPAPRPLLERAALVVFTSGSTGEPKGVVIDAHRLHHKLDMIRAHTGFEDHARTLLALQLTFSFGQWATLLTLSGGGCLVMRARFDPAATVRDLVGERIDRAPLVPTMLRAMLASDATERAADWGGAFMAGGEVLPATVGRRVLATWRAARLGDIYGLTETGTCDFFVRPEEYEAAAGTIGHPGEGIEWRLAAGDGADAGELQIRSPWGMAGYLDAPALTTDAFADGFFRTGDVARRRPDGRVELVGRAKEIIVRAGNKVAPLEVERVFLEHPEIEAALATGMPDPRLGEAVHLLIVPRAGASPDPARLRAWAAERLDRWKLPDRIHVGSVLPLGRTGKADRGALARALAEQR